MSLPSGFLDEIRARVPISRVIGRKVVWDQRKSNQARGDWWAPCPFHQEKSASFHCDDGKGFYYCFGCQAKGDAIGFLREAEGMDFMDAVKRLAAEAGLSMPEPDPRERERTDRRTRLFDVTEAACRWFRLQLQTAGAAEARDYLVRRGLDRAAEDRFDLGYAPDSRTALFEALRAKGFDEASILEAGMAARPDGGGAPFDRFRGRIIFPIRDGQGRVVGFGGRAMDPNARAKYLNSPETPLFDKGRNLYNLGPARVAVGNGQPLVVAEGYMDVIALDRAGFGGAVAPLGTAVTPDQLALMWRVSPEPVIALDGDAAGQRAARRLIDLALPLTGPGQALRFALLPGGQDPDDLIRAAGPGAMRALLDAARPLVDLLWARETEGQTFDSPERRAALDKRLREAVGRIPDDSTRNHYHEELRRKRRDLFAAPFAVKRRVGRATPPGTMPAAARPVPVAAPVPVDARAADSLLEGAALLICAAHPLLVSENETRLERLCPADPDRAALLVDLLSHSESPAGRRGLQALSADPVLLPLKVDQKDMADAAACLRDILCRLDARAISSKEVPRVEAELEGEADEGLTWRLRQFGQARHRIERFDDNDTRDLGEDQAALSETLSRLLRSDMTRKPGKR